jgi:hypothetical protein
MEVQKIRAIRSTRHYQKLEKTSMNPSGNKRLAKKITKAEAIHN